MDEVGLFVQNAIERDGFAAIRVAMESDTVIRATNVVRRKCVSNTIQELYKCGQSVWCDNLSRKLIDSGELQQLVDSGVTGVTSNPAIFMKAITGSDDYDVAIERALAGGCDDVLSIYEKLVLPDIADAADILRPVYDKTDGVDGYVSLEVNPKLAFDTAGTIAEGRRLFAELHRANVMIKVPATTEGIPAVETLIGEGVNVNVTLIFSIAMHEQVMTAYLNGLRRLIASGKDASRVASVASFFVSRVDSLVDKLLGEKGGDAIELCGKAAVANAKLAYARFAEVFDEAGEFGELAAKGARVQRPLWASTSTKNPGYPDTLYVDPLVGPHTVNTMPPNTLEATLDHGTAAFTVGDGVDEARSAIASVAGQGIDLTRVTDQLLVEGVDIFTKAFDELLANLSQKQAALGTAR